MASFSTLFSILVEERMSFSLNKIKKEKEPGYQKSTRNDAFKDWGNLLLTLLGVLSLEGKRLEEISAEPHSV